MFDRKDSYQNFEALKEREREGTDFLIRVRPGRTGITVMAPHGGEIEPGTSEIARAIAGDDHGYYAFEGHKPCRNRVLHITSTHFDEPRATGIARQSRLVVTIHGCHDEREIVFIGGRCFGMRERALKILEACGFVVDIHQRLRGQQPSNLCNRSRRGQGIQVEISFGLRCTLFQDMTPQGRQHPTQRFLCLVEAIREVLAWEPEVEPSHSGEAWTSRGG